MSYIYIGAKYPEMSGTVLEFDGFMVPCPSQISPVLSRIYQTDLLVCTIYANICSLLLLYVFKKAQALTFQAFSPAIRLCPRFFLPK